MSNTAAADNMNDLRPGVYLLNFLLWSALLGFVHYAFFPSYAALLMTCADALLEFITGVALRLGPVPTEGIYGSAGFALLAPGMAQPFHYPHNLYSVTLNFMFAPALVLATLGTSVNAWLRAVAASLIMLLLHTLHVATIALYFPLTQAPLPNPLINKDFPGWLAAFIRWNYTFTDKMGYTLFPFLAWFGVCFGRIVTLLGRLSRPKTPDGPSAEDHP